MNFRLILSTLTAVVAALTNAQSGTSVSIHTSEGNGLSWALVRVYSGVASIGDVAGAHIGEVTHDDLFAVRDGKAYEIRDEAVMRQVLDEQTPLEKIRDQKFKIKSQWRKAHEDERAEERLQRVLERNKQRLERSLDKSTDIAQTDLQRQIADIDRQMADIERQVKAMTAQVSAEQKNVDAAQKMLEGARAKRDSKIETILNEAFSKGLAKPYP